MGRNKEFDVADALDRAMRLFWQRGYAATSMADLVAATGVARAGLYATFGGKHELYLKALDAYATARDPAVVARLAGPGPALPAVFALINDYASADEGRTGCFVVNSAIERLPADAAAALTVEASWSALEAALTSAFSRARSAGELRASTDPAALARMVLVLLQGLRVVGKGRPGSGRATDAAAQAIALITSLS
ncbi:TetR/AcrR family transcriptional repressor of nem operon [Actinoplanes octamycinicus]|uniref:TetR/AcrR family transcriptional repressor of nem operon n=1 Tax=Actinoplanes octamycinicus TaxID=135948 RepID=A0A7W7MC30_9ACTN|nr:TetR/AcrR family transcriptional regulator [Actinoplanes octamycinicus]MBB4744693.1 TetR/AcrR family transcriptional repressor of nem operon [Actinoplanes octamycinicus]GIE55273.1 TetR family transcriptional regulator [Actinoplanes octamycinicus]